MGNVRFNIMNSDNEVLHSFVEEENANKYVELSKEISEERLDVEQEEALENLDLKIVEVVTITANLHLNQTIKLYMDTKKMINIDVLESTSSMPIFLFGIYEYKVVRILPKLKSKQDKFIEDLKTGVNNALVRNYNDYAFLNNLKNIFSFSTEEIALINKVLELHSEVCNINSKFVDESKNEDLQFELFGSLNLLDDISILEKRVTNDILKKYEEYKTLMNEYNIFKAKYKFKP